MAGWNPDVASHHEAHRAPPTICPAQRSGQADLRQRTAPTTTKPVPHTLRASTSIVDGLRWSGWESDIAQQLGLARVTVRRPWRTQQVAGARSHTRSSDLVTGVRGVGARMGDLTSVWLGYGLASLISVGKEAEL